MTEKSQKEAATSRNNKVGQRKQPSRTKFRLKERRWLSRAFDRSGQQKLSAYAAVDSIHTGPHKGMCQLLSLLHLCFWS